MERVGRDGKDLDRMGREGMRRVWMVWIGLG